ncbi:Uncharacterised protein [Mycobacterium tuberculosis]|nr:Uncharacterised protein [Mycobacterium tuberculosis]
MQDAAGRAQVGPHFHLRDHAVGFERSEAHAHEAGEQRVQQFLESGDVVHEGS